MLGPTVTITLDADVCQLIQTTFHISVETATIFYRVTVRGETYYSRSYDRTKARNSYTIEYEDRGGRQQFAFIEYFVFCHTQQQSSDHSKQPTTSVILLPFVSFVDVLFLFQ